MSSYAAQTTGMGFQAYGSIIKGQQTSDLLDNQAATQRRNATQAIMAAKFNADRQSMIATKHIGAMTAGYSASGVDMTSGSVLATIGASSANAELDRLNIIHGGDIRAVNFENQASLDELGARHAIQASYFNALSSMVAGGAGMMGNSTGGGGGTTDSGNQYVTDYSAGDSVPSSGGIRTGVRGGASDDVLGYAGIA